MVTLPPGPVDDWPVQHRVYRYTTGSTSERRFDRQGRSGKRGTIAAKCLCGWEGIGDEAVQAHEALAQ